MIAMNSFWCSYKIEATALSGDPDLYVTPSRVPVLEGTTAHDGSVPSVPVPERPTHLDYTWADQATGSTEVTLSQVTTARLFWFCLKSCTVAQEHPSFRVGRYVVGVRAFGAPGEFQLQVSEGKALIVSTEQLFDMTADVKGADGGHSLAAHAGDQSASTCPNWYVWFLEVGLAQLMFLRAIGSMRPVPPSAMTMHSLQCSRRVYHCPRCNANMKPTERAKHDLLRHTEVPPVMIQSRALDSLLSYTFQMVCDCGESFEQEELQSHRRDECPLRTVCCVYCPLHLTVANR